MIEVMFPITWGGVWDYPYPEAQALDPRHARPLRRGQARLGLGHAERRALLHVPASVDYVRKHCSVPDASEKDRILGGNMAELVGIH